MSDLFNNREIATGIWLGVAVFFGARNADIRDACIGVAKQFFHRKVAGLFLIMGLYAVGCVLLLSRLNLWNVSLIKETVYWVLFTGFVLLLNRMTGVDNKKFFRKTFCECLKVMVLLQFLINFFPMSLLVELILVPFVTILVVMSEMSGQKPEYAAGKKLFDGLMIIFGLFVLIYVARSITLHHADLLKSDVLLSLLLPIWLTLLLFPFLYVAKMVANYESLFLHISFFMNDEALMAYVRWRVIRLCHLNMKRLNRFRREGLSALRSIEDRQSADKLFEEFRLGILKNA